VTTGVLLLIGTATAN